MAAWIITVHVRAWRPKSMTVQGAVIRRDEDTRKELPISGALVTISDSVTSTSTQSDASGYFKITFPELVWPDKTLYLTFSHDGYRPLNGVLKARPRLSARELYVAALEPALEPTVAPSNPTPDHPLSVVSDIKVRYTVNSQTEENIGSAVKTFQAVNKGNVPCKNQSPCSPDGNWKASIGSISLDAGPGNEFRNARASCIAGPCPFTRIDSSEFVNGGRTISASALDWSDTATFLLEAEVFHAAISSNVRMSYPVVYGRALNFTLPSTQEGVSIETDIDGAPMVFPLGPDLYLSWATCNARANTEGERTTVYQCELKPGYRF
jgi:hypothetical protein